MEQDYIKKSPYLEFVACNVELKEGRVCVNLKGKKEGSSAIINNLNNKAALMIAPKECEKLESGALVDIIFMP